MSKKINRCDDTCDNCIYLGEGDFFCDVINEIVIEDWIPLTGLCKVELQTASNEGKSRKGLKAVQSALEELKKRRHRK